MQIPFPGIDPFIEAQGAWPDFHSRFMNAWCEGIAAHLPEAYDARLEERLSVVAHEDDQPPRQPLPDIAISKANSEPSRSASAASEQVATLEPQTNRITIQEEIRDTSIEIRRLADRRLVAVLELLSPTNKVGDGRIQYLQKRYEVMMSEAHLVELDLLIDGKRLPLDKPVRPAHFRAIISRSGKRPACDVYTWSLNQVLPALPVPLIAPDPDIMVNLAEVLATTYQRGRYHKTIKYDSPLDLPLTDDYQVWVKQRIASGAIA